MNKRLLVITVTVAIATLFITAGIYAGTDFNPFSLLNFL